MTNVNHNVRSVCSQILLNPLRGNSFYRKIYVCSPFRQFSYCQLANDLMDVTDSRCEKSVKIYTRLSSNPLRVYKVTIKTSTYYIGYVFFGRNHRQFEYFTCCRHDIICKHQQEKVELVLTLYLQLGIIYNNGSSIICWFCNLCSTTHQCKVTYVKWSYWNNRFSISLKIIKYWKTMVPQNVKYST